MTQNDKDDIRYEKKKIQSSTLFRESFLLEAAWNKSDFNLTMFSAKDLKNSRILLLSNLTP
jgi:hypothetical protein